MNEDLQIKQLRDSVDDARMMRQFADSEIGRGFVELLVNQYEQLITKALAETSYGVAAKSLENLAARIGATIDRGQTARDIIERQASESPSEDW